LVAHIVPGMHVKVEAKRENGRRYTGVGRKTRVQAYPSKTSTKFPMYNAGDRSMHIADRSESNVFRFIDRDPLGSARYRYLP